MFVSGLGWAKYQNKCCCLVLTHSVCREEGGGICALLDMVIYLLRVGEVCRLHVGWLDVVVISIILIICLLMSCGGMHSGLYENWWLPWWNRLYTLVNPREPSYMLLQLLLQNPHKAILPRVCRVFVLQVRAGSSSIVCLIITSLVVLHKFLGSSILPSFHLLAHTSPS